MDVYNEMFDDHIMINILILLI